MKIYKCADGTEYIYFTSMSYKVDEIIELLEKHRGKTLYTGALENPSICITDDVVHFEELGFFTENIAEEEDEWLAEDIDYFFTEEDEDWVAYEDDRRQILDDDTDEDGDEQLTIDGFFDKEGDE